MGRGRGKGKKLTVVASHEDPGSGGEEPLPAYKRRGRPQKPLKDEIDEEAEKIEEEEEEGDDSKAAISSKETKSQAATVENGKKRKRYSKVKENVDSVKDDKGVGTKSNTDESIKSNGFRQNGNRRKSKPRRAAEVGVECK